MKKHILPLVFSCVFCLVSIVSKAQWVSIPDTNFGTWLNTIGYTTCMQGNNSIGWQMDTTCNAVIGDTSLAIAGSSQIRNLTGVEYFKNIRTLVVQVSSLTNLPTLTDSLRLLILSDDSLATIPALPNNLEQLYCGYNVLTSLPALPNTLQLLWCEVNSIRNLPSLPNTLVELKCGSNDSMQLPVLPNTLKRLVCSWNNLTDLPTLPDSLEYLDCSVNRLTEMPMFPDKLTYLNCESNDQLYCLPDLKNLTTLFIDGTAIACLPNYGVVTHSTMPLSFYPICDLLNINGCDVFWNIRGKVYFDGISNCVYDVTDSLQPNIKMDLKRNGSLISNTVSLFNGEYYLQIDTPDIYQIAVDTTDLPFIVTCPSNNLLIDTITPTFFYHENQDFSLICKPGFDVVAKSINGTFRSASVRRVNVCAGDYTSFYGAHCINGLSGNVQLIANGPVAYISPASGALTPTNVSNDTITWNVADFGAINFFSDFNIMMQTDTNAPIGSQICFILIVNPIVGDNNPSNNVLDYCGTVVGSFDPNEKEVYPAGNIDTAQKWLTYTIHFQNTGTAEAQHIYVTDTLDTNVDAASFQLLAYSHQPMVQIKENAVRFDFPNINLPDSNTNEPLSHGYVQYKVKLKDNLPLGTTVNNTAFIYFDFNAPVVTNTTSNTITNVTAVSNFKLETLNWKLFPNPATNSVTISINENMLGSTLTVYDITGRKMSAVQLSVINYQLSIARFAPGIYLLEINKNGEKAVKRLVKE